jgi:hypothetical protein
MTNGVIDDPAAINSQINTATANSASASCAARRGGIDAKGVNMGTL